jgi:hypothetical protein
MWVYKDKAFTDDNSYNKKVQNNCNNRIYRLLIGEQQEQ